MSTGQRREDVPPDRAFPIELQMMQPVGRFDQGRPRAGESIGDARAVRAMAKADVLVGRSAGVADVVCRRPSACAGLDHRGHETEAVPVHRLDVSPRLAVVAQCFAGRANGTGQRRFRDEASLPDCGDELVLRDSAVPVLE